jgi:hypothetical protein
MNFVNRFKEPSSWAGIGVLLSMLFPFVGLSGDAATAVVQAGTALCGAAAIILKEKSA